jgi:hypothetical protein
LRIFIKNKEVYNKIFLAKSLKPNTKPTKDLELSDFGLRRGEITIANNIVLNNLQKKNKKGS